MPWLQALDLFVLPSYGEEGVPQAIMQAMACAIPVVSTPVGAIGEAVEHGVTGLLVAPRSAEALATGVAALRDDAALRTRSCMIRPRSGSRYAYPVRRAWASRTRSRRTLSSGADPARRAGRHPINPGASL